MNGFQLEMNFESSANRLRDCLNNGVFSVLIEHGAPALDTDMGVAAKRLEALEYAALSISELPVSLAITDRYYPEAAHRAVTYASTLPSATRNRHLVYLSGRDTTHREMKGLLRIAANAGLANVIPVSGDHLVGETMRQTRSRSFVEDIWTLHEIQRLNEAAKEHIFCAGAVVNPYKYAPHPLLAQYYKLVKKFNCGAGFVVAQAGFDMIKLQELRWYLTERQFFFPSIARLMLLTPERMDQILRGHFPGMVISAEFQNLLRKELRFSSQQFEAAQWRRLELQAAGCRLLGYSGVQIAGVDTPEKLKTVARRITEALDEFATFDHWLEEYEFYLGRADLAAYSNGFQLFEKMLTRDAREAAPVPTDYTPAPLPAAEHIKHSWRNFLFPEADLQPAGSRRLLKRFFAGCKGCGRCRLPLTFHICPEQCPKRLVNGPCGGAASNGMCELGHDACIFQRITALAEASGAIDWLENEYIPQNETEGV